MSNAAPCVDGDDDVQYAKAVSAKFRAILAREASPSAELLVKTTAAATERDLHVAVNIAVSLVAFGQQLPDVDPAAKQGGIFTSAGAAYTVPGSITLQIWRFVNSTPLLDLDDDALGCQLTAAVRSFAWGQYGYKLRVWHGIAKAKGSRIETSAATADQANILNTPVLLLESTSDRVTVAAAAAEGQEISGGAGVAAHGLLIFMNVMGQEGTECTIFHGIKWF